MDLSDAALLSAPLASGALGQGRLATPLPRVAVVGSGIAGLTAAYALSAHAEVTLFEASSHFGGHAHTVDITLDGVTQGVDTGFLVFNHRTYPGLRALFDSLQVPTAASDMSFSVQWPGTGFEWAGNDLNAVFAQRRNLVRPAFWRMLWDIGRFNAEATTLCVTAQEPASPWPSLSSALTNRPTDLNRLVGTGTHSGSGAGLGMALQTDSQADSQAGPTVGDYLRSRSFGSLFCEAYFLPMVACIWSCPREQMLQYPLRSLLQFCHNHGLLQVQNRPQWYTVRGGSREYVRRLVGHIQHKRLDAPVRGVAVQAPGSPARVLVRTEQGNEGFDAAVLACHSDQALAMLEQPRAVDRAVLGAIHYRPNRALLHTDAALLPKRRRAWAAWNFEGQPGAPDSAAGVCLHYLINRLQPLAFEQPVIVSLNPVREPRMDAIHGEYRYAHPVFDSAALAAQSRLCEIQGGERPLWFCGAWAGHGFHEDGLRSGLNAARGLLQQWQQGLPSQASPQTVARVLAAA